MNAVTESNRMGDWRIFGVFGLWAMMYLAARGLLELQTLGWWPRVAIARRIQLEALAFAFPMTLLLIMTLGLLEIGIGLNPDDWSYRHLWPMLFILYFAGLARAKRRYE